MHSRERKDGSYNEAITVTVVCDRVESIFSRKADEVTGSSHVGTLETSSAFDASSNLLR